MDKDFEYLMQDLRNACDKYFERAKGEHCDIDFTVRTLQKIVEDNKGSIIVEIAVSYAKEQSIFRRPETLLKRAAPGKA